MEMQPPAQGRIAGRGLPPDGWVAVARRWMMTALSAWLLAGAFVFYSEWTLWKGLFWGAVALLLSGWHRDVAAAWKGAVVFRWGVLWLVWMLGVSFLHGGAGGNEVTTFRGWCWGAAGLAGWWVMLFHTGRDAAATRVLGWTVAGAAAASAVYSVVHYGFFVEHWHWGHRLSNGLVYGGWNQVCSGVTWGFAAVWALAPALDGTLPRRARAVVLVLHPVLIFAALCSLSRGALLVMLAGHGMALLLCGWKSGAGAGLLRLGAVFALFHLVMPALAPKTEGEMQRRHPRIIDANPLTEWSRRGDTGRFEMYEEVAKLLARSGPNVWLTGVGQWGANSLWNSKLENPYAHPHSVFVATLLHGGVIGLAGLCAVLAAGLKGAWDAARRQHWPAGLMLAAAGLAGVIFDGHSLASLDSIPRFEPLIAWTGLLLAAGRTNSGQPS